jgi:hypothetical protein
MIKNKVFLLLVLSALYSTSAVGQFTMKAQAGLSYIEHVSTGVAFGLGRKHTIMLLVGSNLFINMYEFSNYFIQYDYSFTKWKINNATPRLGVRGGDSHFTDDIYRWHVVHVIPFAGITYPVHAKMNLLVDFGAAFSFEQAVERVGEGEVGHYKELLPEIKVGILYTFYQKK